MKPKYWYSSGLYATEKGEASGAVRTAGARGAEAKRPTTGPTGTTATATATATATGAGTGTGTGAGRYYHGAWHDLIVATVSFCKPPRLLGQQQEQLPPHISAHQTPTFIHSFTKVSWDSSMDSCQLSCAESMYYMIDSKAERCKQYTIERLY